ncbi:MAG: hypothetical protein ACKODH_17045 [Limisphaerales bacterium]
MTPTPDTVYEEALALPESIRLELVERLLPTIGCDLETDGAQFAVVQQRCSEVEYGCVKLVPGDVVLREVRAALAAKHGR